MGRLRSFFRLPSRRRALLLEAALLLICAEFAVHVLKVNRIRRRLGRYMATTPEAGAAQEIRRAHAVSWAVLTAARHLPWHPVCLPQALAARWMLRRRRVASTLYLGVSKTEGLTAHAWVRVGGFVVTGRNGKDAYTVVATFA